MRRGPVVAGVVALAVAVVVAAVALADPSGRRSGPRLDPTSTSDDGSRAAVLLLEELGFDVEVGDVPRPGETDALIILVDDLDDDGWQGVERFVAQGGDLVLAVPFAPLAPPVGGTTSTASVDQAGCGIAELGSVTEVDVPVLRVFEGAGTACLMTDRGPAARSIRIGRGRVLALGSSHPFRNDALESADHAAFVVGAASWTSGSIRVLVRRPVGTGDATLAELVPNWVWAGLVQLAVAVAFYALWRAIRLGPPIEEADEIGYDAAELVEAAGGFSAHTGDDAWALQVVRARWLEDLRDAAGWRGDVTVDLVDALGLGAAEAEVLQRTLTGTGTGDALAAAADIHAARRILAVAGAATGPEEQRNAPDAAADVTMIPSQELEHDGQQ